LLLHHALPISFANLPKGTRLARGEFITPGSI
jgi:hypothetical protein